MLSELRIRNFALIEALTVELGPGLNVLTGETGAGKSIVVGALSLLVGERASVEVIRDGADRASVEGVFGVEGHQDLAAWLSERGIEPVDESLILKREVAREGRSRAWVNGSPVTVSILGELGSALISIHGQHQHQTLLRRDEQRAIVDAFGGLESLGVEVKALYHSRREISAEIDRLDQRRREALQRADLLRFQVDEIESSSIEVGEEERLADESRRLSHAEELLALAEALSGSITGDADSTVSKLGSARRGLDQLVRIDPSRADLSELYDTAYYALEELGSRLQEYLTIVEHDPARLEEIRRRQDQLYRLRSKYGPLLTDVLSTLASARAELALIDEADWELSRLDLSLAGATEELAVRAGALSEQRRVAAAAIETEVNRILPEVGMSGGRFDAVLLSTESIGEGGAEEIEFRVALNRGFDPRPLAQVASGGELSRVMLAIKTILARLENVPTLIFDEVDAGIGGRVALQVGDKLREVAGIHQVLAITHLPQIASRAHRHLHVAKEDTGGRTATTVVRLDNDGRTREIARMLGGDPESETSRAHARELLARQDSVRFPS